MFDSKLYDIQYGRHSNIPECCIRFFVEEWAPKQLYLQTNLPVVKAVRKSKARYVQCPECIAQKIVVRLRLCLTDCGRDCRLDFLEGGQSDRQIVVVRNVDGDLVPASARADEAGMHGSTPL